MNLGYRGGTDNKLVLYSEKTENQMALILVTKFKALFMRMPSFSLFIIIQSHN